MNKFVRVAPIVVVTCGYHKTISIDQNTVPLQCSRKWHLRTVLRPLQAADPSFQGTNPDSRGESIQKTDATIEDARGETLLHNRDRGAQRDSRARRVHAAVRNLRHR